MHWQFGEMEFGEMKRNTSNWSNFGMLLRRAGLTASAALSCCHFATTRRQETRHRTLSSELQSHRSAIQTHLTVSTVRL